MEIRQVRLWYTETNSFYYGFMVDRQFFLADSGEPFDLEENPPDEIKEFPLWVDLHDELEFHDYLN